MSFKRIFATLVLALACSVDRDLYSHRLFLCDISASDTTGCGDDFSCYGSSRYLGAPDFCAPSCIAGVDLENGLCSASGQRITTCRPSQPTCSEQGFECIRTNLAFDEGICLPVSACQANKDCTDPVRHTCLGTLLGEIYAGTTLQMTQLFCAQTDCAARFSACAPGTSCMASLVPGLPDACVPDCNDEATCPPNFVCSSRILERSGPPFCVPGLLGFRCDKDVDCLVGRCLPFGDRSLCALGCETEADCATYDNPGFGTGRMTFTCHEKQCVSPASFLFGFCEGDADCKKGEHCSAPLPANIAGREIRICGPECIFAEGGTLCPDRAGMPNTCYGPSVEVSSVCVPAMFSLGCSREGRCVGDLTCETGSAGSFCSRVCASDTDCQGRWLQDATCEKGQCMTARHDTCDGGSCFSP